MKAHVFAVCVILAACTAVANDDPPEPWLEAPSFEVAPAILLSSAYAHPFSANADAVLLLHESTTKLDERHRMVTRLRRIYRLLNPAGVRDWSNVSLDYSPWYQERPTVRARVITPDAVSHELDPDTLVESPFGAQSPNVFTDRRLLAGPLPAVSVGSVVEIEIELRDREPLFDAGVARWTFLQYPFPVRKLRVVIEVPSTFPFRHALRGVSGTEMSRSDKNGRTRWLLELGPTEATEEREPFVPFSEPPGAYLSWSTGESWAAVARRYSEIVEERLQGANVEKLAKKALKGAKTPMEKITAIVSRLHAEVRYTGVQFGQSGIVPAPPGTTLERKFGDCKDTAALLVALLREAGFRANVALVDSGVEPDLDAEMPGLGFFDHAIVHVADPEIWIDPTSPYAQPGVLAIGVEGRIALIAAPGTKSTTRIPDLTAEGNRQVEIREVFLAERGGARIVETTEAFGLQEMTYRELFASAEVEDQHKQMKPYIQAFFASESEFQLNASDPADLNEPFRIELQIEDAEIAYAGPDQALVSVPTILMASELRKYLPRVSSTNDDSDDARREANYRVPWPYLLEWHYRIHPAPGFAAAPLPPEELTRMGPVTLRRRFSQEEDGTVTADLSFDTGKRHWTPGELETVWDGLEQLEQQGAVFLSFEQVGRKHLANGEVREALEEFRRLAALHPAEALHRSEIAEALLAAGLGEAARVDARRAVELEPEDDNAHRTLGWILLHDPIGRFLEPGFDPVAAESAFRKARELDPSAPENRAFLAYLLGSDFRYLSEGSGARLDEAIAEYRSIRDELDDHSYDLALARALLRAARFEELGQLALELPPSMERNSLWIAAVTALEGVDKGLARAWNLANDPEQRHELIGQAADLLHTNRLYPQAGRLLSQGLPKDSVAPDLAYAIDVLTRTMKHEQLKLDEEKGPVGFLKRVYIEAIGLLESSGGFSDYLANVYQDLPNEVNDFPKYVRLLFRMLQPEMAAMDGQVLEVGLDMFLAMGEWTVDGDATNGYRCRMRMPMPGEERQFTYYVVVEDAEYRLLAVEPNYWILGLEALRRLDAEEVIAARHLIDWVYDARPSRRSEDPLAVIPFLLFWDPEAEASKDSVVRFAAAALVAGSPGSEAVVSILERGRDSADEAEQPKFDISLAAAYFRLKRWDDLLASARRLRAVHPDSEQGFRFETRALLELERWDELSRVANERLQAKKHDVAALQILSSAATKQNRHDEAAALLKRIIDTGKAGPIEYNNLAWSRVVQRKVDAEALQFAERAAIYNATPSAAAYHTLASVYAEVGRFTEARDLVLRQMVMRGVEEPGSLEWHVFGRIAEGYGEREAAAVYYARVLPPDGDDDDCEPCYTIAQQRLEALKAGLSSIQHRVE